MKILVIDDNPVHLNSAIQILSGHDVVLCSSYDEADHLLYHDKEAALPYWDAVLCDLLMPAGKKALGPNGRKFIGLEMPVGWSLALMAVKNGAKYVAVVTDTNHHDHPASAMIDSICRHIFDFDGTKLLLTNLTSLVGEKGKKWGLVLEVLQGKRSPNCM